MEFIDIRDKVVRDIDFEWEIPSMVADDAVTVHIDLAGLVDCSEVQDEPHAGHFFCCEDPVIPEDFIRHELPVHAGEKRFRRERDDDEAVVIDRSGVAGLKRGLRSYRVLPASVQVDIGASNKLRARVFREHAVLLEFFTPRCIHSYRIRLLLAELK